MGVALTELRPSNEVKSRIQVESSTGSDECVSRLIAVEAELGIGWCLVPIRTSLTRLCLWPLVVAIQVNLARVIDSARGGVGWEPAPQPSLKPQSEN